MIIVSTISETRNKLNELRKNSLSLGFVPTMGALHEGHISLISRSIQENDLTAISIFVNPNQFNQIQDFVSYPRDLQKDLEIIGMHEVNLVFTPSAEEIYPVPDTRVFDFSGLDLRMEGKYRPGHFNGVAQVVSRLFEIIEPDRAYFGEKDFQQLAIIRRMTRDLDFSIQIVGCPIIREKDGLAMSSRNQLLSGEERKSAARISVALFRARDRAGKTPVKSLIKDTCQYIEKDPKLRVEYFEIVDSQNLQALSEWPEQNSCIACIAVQIGKVRLIDNVKISS